MFSQPGIRASRTAQQERETPTMSEPSSPGSRTLLAFFDPDTSSLKMSQGTFQWEPSESLERLPAWGTTSGGVLYELQTPERLTAARDGSASPGLPTPVVNDMGAGKTVETWDTWTDEMKARHGNGNGHGPSLSIEVQRLLPTPTVNDSHNHNPPPSQFNRNSLALPALVTLLPTPQATDCKIFGPNLDWKKRQENHADSVASVLMNLPLNDGSESSDDEHPTQLTIEGCDPPSSPG